MGLTADMARKRLKSQNWPYILPYIGLHLVAFYAVTTGSDDIWKLTEGVIKSATWSVASGFLALIMNGLLTGEQKATLVFWRLTHPLPGSEAFSKYLHSDPRIDPSILKSRYGELPVDPTEQNRLWYKMYRRHEEDPGVRDAHGSYLAARDLTALSAMFLIILGPAAALIARDTLSVVIYAALLCMLYALTSKAARTYGCRFVTNVLAAETST